MSWIDKKWAPFFQVTSSAVSWVGTQYSEPPSEPYVHLSMHTALTSISCLYDKAICLWLVSFFNDTPVFSRKWPIVDRYAEIKQHHATRGLSYLDWTSSLHITPNCIWVLLWSLRILRFTILHCTDVDVAA